jgi:hypothetical protein
MKTLDLPSAFKMLPNRIEGAGVEVFLLDSLPGSNDSFLELHLHTLMIILDGSVIVTCDAIAESIGKDEAIMMKKNSTVQMDIPNGGEKDFRCLLIFFDEPSLKYALMPFELSSGTANLSVLKIPLNEKIKVFTDSILLYYQSFKEKNNWTLLLQGKLRELIWIFFHTNIKDQAKAFFSVPA